MSEQGYLETPKVSNRAIKPAAITLLLAGTAGLYAALQTEPAANSEPAAKPDNDASVAPATLPASQAEQASAAPQFGQPAVADPAPALDQAPDQDQGQGISASIASAATSAAKTVKDSVKGAIAAAVPEKRSAAVARIELPAPGPVPAIAAAVTREPSAVQRIVLPPPGPAPASSTPEFAATAPEPADLAQVAPAIATAPANEPLPKPVAIAEAPPPVPAPVSRPVPASEPAPIAAPVAAAPAMARAPEVALAQTPAPAEQPAKVQAFAGVSFAALPESRMADLRPIGGAAAVAQSAPAAKPRVAAGLAANRAVAPSRPAAAPKLAMQVPRAGSAARGSRIGGAGSVTGPGLNGYRMVGDIIEFKMPVQVNGENFGKLTMHIAPDDKISLHLKELVAMFEQQLDPELVTALRAAPSIDEFVSFERLRAAGIDIRYDAVSNQVILAADS